MFMQSLLRRTVAILLLFVGANAGASSYVTVPTLSAVSVQGETPVLDGKLNELVWERASVATDFVQLQPDEGASGTEPSEVRILYSHDALYIGFRAYDANPEDIEAQLTRRDQGSFSDWVYVAVDSYHDRRTAYQFSTNPVGVKRDSYRYNDTRRDSDWDAVWDVATSTDQYGWTAEFRIPYSQLRFNNAEEHTWGIQFMRYIARKNEMVAWSPLSGDDNAMVSRFGLLEDLEGIRPSRRLEVTPYSVSSLRRAPGDSNNPFYEKQQTESEFGLDVKYGLTSNLTLDVTINPDFGQVEADPAQVNLSDFETFFPERRLFFLEGASIFDFSLGDGNRLFHSRRIGRRPQGWADPHGGYVRAPEDTTIQAAAKLTGKTENNVTMGLLYGSTAREQADVYSAEGETSQQVVEPATHYSMVRLQKDLREGRSVVGLVATGVVREQSSADALEMHSRAFTGGIDFQHRFWGGDYRVSGYLLSSRVQGTEEAIARTQRASGRYLHRPDADHLAYDPTRTSLSGHRSEIQIAKVGGGFWRYGFGMRQASPEFEANDLGFQNRADFRVAYANLEYDHYLFSKHLRSWRISTNAWHWETTGGEVMNRGFGTKARVQFHNHWNLWASANANLGALSVNALRGGPAMQQDDNYAFSVGFNTDGREKVTFNLNLQHGHSQSGSRWWGISPSVFWRPAGRIQLSAGAFYDEGHSAAQWVTRIDQQQPHYVFGEIDRKTAGLTIRMDYAFSRDLTLELYARPYVSAGAYANYMQVMNPKAASFAGRFTPLWVHEVGNGFATDLNQDGTDEFFADPSFNFRQFRTNAMLRWEFNPGSTLYAVWSHGQQSYAPTGEFNPGDDMSALFDAPADDIFLLKLNYWLSP